MRIYKIIPLAIENLDKTKMFSIDVEIELSFEINSNPFLLIKQCNS